MFKDPYDERHLIHGDKWILARAGRRVKTISDLNQVSFEGWGVGIAAAGLAVSAGSAIASGVQKSDAAGALQDAASKRPKIVPATFTTPDQATNNYVDYYSNSQPYYQSIATQENAANNTGYQQSLGTINPSLVSSVGTQGAVANDLINARIPADVQAQVQRSSAYQALTGQGSTDSGSAHALTARDLGTTSLGLEQQGSNMLASSIANTKALNPYATTAQDLMLTPQQLLARDDSNTAYANGVLNGNNNIAYQNSLNAAAANSYNPALSGLTSGAGALGTALNGSVGQSLGKGLSSYFGSSSTGSNGYGDYMTPGSNSYDQNAVNASGSGAYNPFLDVSNYDEDGSFIGNANSFGG